MPWKTHPREDVIPGDVDQWKTHVGMYIGRGWGRDPMSRAFTYLDIHVYGNYPSRVVWDILLECILKELSRGISNNDGSTILVEQHACYRGRTW